MVYKNRHVSAKNIELPRATTATASEVTATREPQPDDLFVGSRVRQWGWMRDGMQEVAFLFQQKLDASELREVAAWATKVADYIDRNKKPNS
jgi:hypothetical protein